VSRRVLKRHLDWVNTTGILAFPVRLWDAVTRAPFLKSHLNWVNTVVILTSVVAFLVNTAILWHNIASRYVLKSHLNEVHLIAFSPDSKLLTSASNYKTVRL
jgi:WD40 repeat protein